MMYIAKKDSDIISDLASKFICSRSHKLTVFFLWEMRYTLPDHRDIGSPIESDLGSYSNLEEAHLLGKQRVEDEIRKIKGLCEEAEDIVSIKYIFVPLPGIFRFPSGDVFGP